MLAAIRQRYPFGNPFAEHPRRSVTPVPEEAQHAAVQRIPGA